MEIEQDPLPLPPSNHSLVNRVATPKPKQTTMNNTNGPSYGAFDGSVLPNQNLEKATKKQLLKKHIKRRLLTRAYQERLTNMAEARKEIVTALRIHRASMKHATVEEQQQKPPLPQKQQEGSLSLKTSNVSRFAEDGGIKSRSNPSTTCKTTISNHKDDFSFSSSHPPPPNSNPNTSHVTPSAPSANPPPKEKNPNLTIPNQKSGLNLSLHPFNNLEAPPFPNNKNNDNTNSSLCSYTSPKPSSPPLVTHDQDVPSIGTSNSQGEAVSSVVDEKSNATIHSTRDLHIAMDDEGMEEIRLLGHKQQMYLDDTLSLINSTYWFNYLKNMEHGATHHEDGVCQIFEELGEFSTWLNYYENQVCLEQCPEDYSQDPTLLWYK